MILQFSISHAQYKVVKVTVNHWLLCTIVIASNMLSVTLKLKHLDNMNNDMTEFHNDELNVIVMTQLLVILILMK